jgi:hypothetical protein
MAILWLHSPDRFRRGAKERAGVQSLNGLAVPLRIATSFVHSSSFDGIASSGRESTPTCSRLKCVPPRNDGKKDCFVGWNDPLSE